ncbi:M48 family metallopeptidase [Pseudodesulfovibrio sp. zrk46]|uniref:M48 family metallopeptidase n=1 Tax=Pseudodesulfovibrio sp. zrk46 TaxID=2725288 RepID=UPI00144A16F2|nr:M48 family metallopeptidase [Pseudodesulfovibrio sp. zrk46]QJB55098.1 M48 family metallopeptidase [Pseudodesulfovibrio sp. zrk46]
MNAFLVVILASLALSWLLGVLSNILGSRHLSPEVPAEFIDVYDAETYAKSQRYARASMRFSTLADTAGTVLTFALILGGVFNWLDVWLRTMEWGQIPTGLAYIGLLSLASYAVSLPFEIYQTFVLENRFGFNTTTVKTFVTDRIKGLVLNTLLGGGLLAGILYFFDKTGQSAWLWCWGLATAFTLGLTYVAPTWILPLFNKFTPLEEGELRTALVEYARKTQFELSGIFVMDGSKRSTKGNAFFTGFGKRRRIALFDTLIDDQDTSEIVAVLAHEVGHAKRGHIRKRLAVGILKTGVVFYLMSIFMHSPGLFAAFGMENMSNYAGLVFFVLLYTPVSLVLSVLANRVSRKHEFEADAYAAETTGDPGAMISALKKLSASNLSNLTPHPLTVWLDYGHPPVLERVRALSKQVK